MILLIATIVFMIATIFCLFRAVEYFRGYDYFKKTQKEYFAVSERKKMIKWLTLAILFAIIVLACFNLRR